MEKVEKAVSKIAWLKTAKAVLSVVLRRWGVSRMTAFIVVHFIFHGLVRPMLKHYAKHVQGFDRLSNNHYAIDTDNFGFLNVLPPKKEKK